MSEGMDNDTRGWIMAVVSGVACIFGACIICVDTIVRLCPGGEDFKIQNSDTFLSSSLSLSFGVMLFSALYGMLPECKNSLLDGGLSASKASWVLIVCFLGGALGIQVLSRIFHHFIPSHVVGCEHSHDLDEEGSEHTGGTHAHEPHEHTRTNNGSTFSARKQKAFDVEAGRKDPTETEPLLPSRSRPPLLTERMSSFLTGSQTVCDGRGRCFGYSDPCGKECFKIKSRGSRYGATINEEITTVESEIANVGQTTTSLNSNCGVSSHSVDGSADEIDECSNTSTVTGRSPEQMHEDNHHSREHSSAATTKQRQHHHHVPTNAFLSIGVQTSFAIALHKLPEGFITYATNHANPELGFAIFIALFIHNITEGFALALPLFLAIQSRWKAIAIATILGGASQPLGAAIAALWFKASGPGDVLTSNIVYGCMFGITSGIMTSVALQLFSESLGLTHSRTMCVVWAFVGMAILGISNALTA